MRKAFIGLSSPTAYYYDHDKSYFKEEWPWNPILESPQGLVTLFDELWFLSRALCPVSLRKETYVKFLDEDSDFEKSIRSIYEKGKDSNELEDLLIENSFVEKIIDLTSTKHVEQFQNYNQIINTVYGKEPGANTPIDNHSGFKLYNFNVNCNSVAPKLLALDMIFLNHLKIKNIELITNRFNSTVFRTNPSTIRDTQISQAITINRIPVIQTPFGPIIEEIEKIRESKYLIDFRNKIIDTDKAEESSDLVSDIEREFNDYRNNVLIKRHQESKILRSIARNAYSFAIGMIIPGAGEVKSLGEDAQTRSFDWTAFLSELEKNDT